MSLAFCLGFRNWHVQHLRRCLVSIRAHTDAPIMLCDLGSDDLAAVQNSLFDDVTLLVYPQPEWSRSIALNFAADQSPRDRGVTHYVFTDADMIFPGSWFEYVETVNLDANVLWLTRSRDLHPVSMAILDLKMTGFKIEDQWLYDWSSPHGNDLGQGAAMIVPRVWFEKVGGFDEYYRVWGCEDNDLTMRAEWDGLTVQWLDNQAWVAHQWHRRDWPTPEQLAQVRRNREYFYQRLVNRGPIVRNI